MTNVTALTQTTSAHAHKDHVAKIEIYTKPDCPYCHAAKDLLTKKGLAFTEIDILGKADLRAAMITRAKGGVTVPQIFIKGRHLGGCDDLYRLNDAGELDAWLSA